MLQKSLFVSGAGGPLLLWGCRLRRVVTARGAYLCVQYPWGAFGQPQNLRDSQDLPEGVRSASSTLGSWLLQVLRVTAHEWGHIPVGGVGPGGEERAPVPDAGSPLGSVPAVTSPRWKGPDAPWAPRSGRYWAPRLQKACELPGQIVRPGWGSFQGRGPH